MKTPKQRAGGAKVASPYHDASNPEVATTLNNIKAQGEHKLALEKYHESLRVKEATFGKNHPDVATTLDNMGRVYEAQGQHKLALEHFQDALRIQSLFLPDDHPDRLDTLESVQRLSIVPN